ncbi:MAG: hypothetical protein Q7R30_09220 [Acidobacteriota bacterium]|nr:hypothetical protein [Acidobacteriota bacterium]
MNMIRWMGRGLVRRIGDTMRMLPFARPDRAPGGPTLVESPHRSAPPPAEAGDGSAPLEPQHHVHPTDDEARRQGKG